MTETRPDRRRSRSPDRRDKDRRSRSPHRRPRSPERARSRSPRRDRRSRSRSPRREPRDSRRSPRRARSRSRSRSVSRSRRRSRSRDRHHKSRSRSASSRSSSSDSDGSRDRRKRRKRHDKEERRREKKARRKEKRERKGKEKKHKGKSSAVTGQWGQYGIINESHMYEKDAEFRTWLVEECKVNPEALSKEATRKHFAQFVEDYNTATLPHPKFYNIESYERQMNSLRNGMTADITTASYDPSADMAAHSSRHKRPAAEPETHLTREQLMELRKVQNERVEAGKMKLLGMDIKGNFGVRMDTTYE